jgi:hypothetical protein
LLAVPERECSAVPKSIVVTGAIHVGDTIAIMTASSTTTVEIDSNLLDRLRQRHPAKNDRELLEGVARAQLDREASDRASECFRGVSSYEIEREAVKAVREVRRERAARRLAAG